MTQSDTDYLKLDKQLCFALYSATNAMIRAYRPLLEQLDLTYPQYIVMMVLWEQDGISLKQIGEKTHLDSGTLTPLLKRLEKKGLITRSRSEEDERVRVLTLTAQGVTLKDEAKAIPEQMFCRAQLPLEQLEQLKQGCERLNKNLDNPQ